MTKSEFISLLENPSKINEESVNSLKDLKKSFDAIKKRLGGLALKQAIEHIDNQDYKSAAILALKYYDKTYNHGLEVNDSPDISIINLEKIVQEWK